MYSGLIKSLKILKQFNIIQIYHALCTINNNLGAGGTWQYQHPHFCCIEAGASNLFADGPNLLKHKRLQARVHGNEPYHNEDHFSFTLPKVKDLFLKINF